MVKSFIYILISEYLLDIQLLGDLIDNTLQSFGWLYMQDRSLLELDNIILQYSWMWKILKFFSYLYFRSFFDINSNFVILNFTVIACYYFIVSPGASFPRFFCFVPTLNRKICDEIWNLFRIMKTNFLFWTKIFHDPYFDGNNR